MRRHLGRNTSTTDEEKALHLPEEFQVKTIPPRTETGESSKTTPNPQKTPTSPCSPQKPPKPQTEPPKSNPRSDKGPDKEPPNPPDPRSGSMTQTASLNGRHLR